mgnify:FL=1
MDEKKVREAIKALKITIDIGKQKIEYNKTFEPKNDNEPIEKSIEHAKTAIEALEKQLPKKSKQADEQRIRYCTTYVCPGCGKEFTGMVSEYCYHCGQRIEYDD